MKRLCSVVALAAVALGLTSCSTNRGKTLLGMGVAALAGGTLGALTAPQNERAEGHALMWAGLSSGTAGALGLFVFDEEAKSNELHRQNDVLMKSLNALNGEGDDPSGQLVYESNSPFGKDVPSEYRGLVKPGRWSVYKLNRWTVNGENTLIHQDKMIQLEPPTFSNSLSQTQNPEEVKNEQK